MKISSRIIAKDRNWYAASPCAPLSGRALAPSPFITW